MRLQAFLRAGCVQLTFEAQHRSQQQPEVSQQLAQALGRHMGGRRVLVQQGPRASIVANGEGPTRQSSSYCECASTQQSCWQTCQMV